MSGWQLTAKQRNLFHGFQMLCDDLPRFGWAEAYSCIIPNVLPSSHKDGLGREFGGKWLLKVS